jgi:hypothetical protein
MPVLLHGHAAAGGSTDFPNKHGSARAPGGAAPPLRADGHEGVTRRHLCSRAFLSTWQAFRELFGDLCSGQLCSQPNSASATSAPTNTKEDGSWD